MATAEPMVIVFFYYVAYTKLYGLTTEMTAVSQNIVLLFKKQDALTDVSNTNVSIRALELGTIFNSNTTLSSAGMQSYKNYVSLVDMLAGTTPVLFICI